MRRTFHPARAVALIVARMDTPGLPGRPLLPLGGTTVLEQVLRRVQAARCVTHCVVATTDREVDRPLRDFCAHQRVHCCAHPEGDPVSIGLAVAHGFGVGAVALCDDSQPLMSSGMLEACVRYAVDAGMDYVTVKPMPEGTVPEVISVRALTRLASVREDTGYDGRVSEWLALYPEWFESACLPAPIRLRSPDVRLVLETQSDYQQLAEIFLQVPPNSEGLVALEDVLDCLEDRRVAHAASALRAA
ncbi:MAG: NTP transferase domain-containing protein [Chloroherpetonaceae bacterium]|nr:NTP transferase domain-containing protein [Chthonomonadaceae bacterium]MDW8206709.1 NTP transferase domain-containing protein [Chloroherpetonaceae bacterium]